MSIRDSLAQRVSGRRGNGFRANADGVFDGKLCGWAFDGTDRRVEVIARVDGAEVSRGPADIRRADLAASGIGDGSHAFGLQLPTGFSFQLGAMLELVDSATGECVRRKISRKRYTQTLGHVDPPTNGVVKGWLYMPWRPGERLDIELRQGKSVLATTVQRDFLTGLPGVGNGRFGFSFTLTSEMGGPLSVRCTQSGWEQVIPHTEYESAQRIEAADSFSLQSVIAENARLRAIIERDRFEIDANRAQLQLLQAELERLNDESAQTGRMP